MLQYFPLMGDKWVLLAWISRQILLSNNRDKSLSNPLGFFWWFLALGIIFGSLAGNALTRPMTKLAKGTLAFASGKFDQRVDINTHDEIGDLAKTFNSMAGEIQNLIGSLENRVTERTADLEIARLTKRTTRI